MSTLDNILNIFAGYDIKDYERQLLDAVAQKDQQINSFNAKAKALEAEKNKLLQKLAFANNEIANRESVIERSSKTITVLSSERDAFNEKAKALEAEKNKLLQQLAFANSEIANRESVIERSSQTIKTLSSEKGGLTTSNNKLKKLVSEQEQEIYTLKSDFDELSQRHNKLSEHAKDVENQLSSQKQSLETELETALSKVKDMEDRESETAQTIAHLSSEIQEKNKHIKENEERQQATSTEINDLTEKIRILQKELSESKEQNLANEKLKQSIEEAKENLTKENRDLSSKISKLEASIVAKDQELEQKQNEIHDLKDEINKNKTETGSDCQPSINQPPIPEEKKVLPQEKEEQPPIESEHKGENGQDGKSPAEGAEFVGPSSKSEEPSSGTSSNEKTNDNPTPLEEEKPTEKQEPENIEPIQPRTQEEQGDDAPGVEEEPESEVHQSVRRIEKIFDTETQQEIKAEQFFNQPESELIKRRAEFDRCIKLGEKRYLCTFCKQQVKIAGRKFERGQVSFFAHLHDSADCPIKTSINMSKEEIEARKYGLCQESARHQQLKNLISVSLKDSPSKARGIDNVEVEKRINASIPYLNWRKPDVCCTYNETNVVFELQLSTTFLSTIVDRDIFYRLHHYYIIWVFNFDKNVKYVDLSNLMMKDIYYTNKRNIFVFDRQAQDESKKRGELVLKCNWLTPENAWKYPVKNNPDDGLNVGGVLVTLKDLTFDETSGKVYYHDAEEEYYQAHPEAAEIEQRIENDRKQLMERWMQHVQRNEDVPSEEEMAQIVSQMIEKGETATIYSSDNRRGLEYGSRHLTTPQYSSIERKEDYFLAKFNRKTALYDKYGRQILPCEYLNILFKEFGLIFAESTDKWNILFDGKMDFVCERKPHDEIAIKQDGILLTVKVIHSNIPNDTAYILTDGISVIPTVFHDIKDYKEDDYTFVRHENSWGVYSKDLKLIIPIEYKSITPIKNSNIVCAQKDGSICLVNLNDGTIQELPYESVRFDNDYLIVSAQGEKGVINAEGQIIVPVVNYSCSSVAGCYFEVEASDDWETDDDGLYNDQGKLLLQCSYKRIEHLRDGIFSICKNEKYAIYDAANESFVFGEKWFDGIHSNKEKSLFELVEGNKHALANFEGEILTPFKYEKIEFSYDGTIKVRIGDAQGTIDENGNEINDKEITLTEGYVATSFFSKWNVVHDGKECVSRVYDGIEYLYDDWLKVKKNDMWGICDLNGEILLPKEYSSIIFYKDFGFLVVNKDERFGILDKKLETVVPIAFSAPIKPISCDYALIGNNPKGLLSIKTNDVIIPQFFSDIHQLGNELFEVIKRTEQRNFYRWSSPNIIVKYGLYDKSGKEIFPCDYKEISLISDNLVKVRQDTTYILYRISDHQKLNKWAYSAIESFNDEGVASVKTYRAEGFINCDGEPVYTDLETFADGTIKFGFLGKCGLKSTDGHIIINCEYDSIRYLTNGIYAFELGYQWGVKDQNGVKLLNSKYLSVRAISNNLLEIGIESGRGYHSSTKFSIYNIENRHIEEEQFDTIGTLNENQQIPVTRSGKTFYLDSNGTPILQINETIDNKYTIVNRLEKYGINDIDGSVLIECQYASISHIKKNVFAVVGFGYGNYKWGLIDTLGNKLLDNNYDEIKPLSDVLVKVCNFSYLPVCCLYNLSTRQLDDLEYSSISDLDENREIHVVYKSHKGRINSIGEKIYEKTTAGDDYVIYSYLGKYGLEANGEKIIGCVYDGILYIGSHFFIITNNGKQGLFCSAEQILPIEYQQIAQLADNLISIKDANGCQLYDLSQRKAITKYYQYIDVPNESGLLKVSRVGKEGFINQEGKVQYERNEVGGGYSIVSAFGTYGIADKEGKHISPCNFAQVKYLYGDLFAILTKKWRLYSASATKFYTEALYDKIWYDESKATIFALRDNLQGELTASGEEVMRVLPIDLGEHLSVMQCFGKIGVKNTESGEWKLPMEYQRFKKAGAYILFCKDYEWGIMNQELEVLIGANYKRIKAWTADTFVVAERQYKSYGWKLRYGIISGSGEKLLRCNYVKILVVNKQLVAVYTKMNERPTYYTLQDSVLQAVMRDDLPKYVGENHFNIGEEYDACITNKTPFNGIFVKVNEKGVGLIPKTSLPKDYMKQENLKRGKAIKVKVTSINELNQVKFSIVTPDGHSPLP